MNILFGAALITSVTLMLGGCGIPVQTGTIYSPPVYVPSNSGTVYNVPVNSGSSSGTVYVTPSAPSGGTTYNVN